MFLFLSEGNCQLRFCRSWVFVLRKSLGRGDLSGTRSRGERVLGIIDYTSHDLCVIHQFNGISKRAQNIPYHDPCATNHRFAVTNLRIDFNSIIHNKFTRVIDTIVFQIKLLACREKGARHFVLFISAYTLLGNEVPGTFWRCQILYLKHYYSMTPLDSYKTYDLNNF